MKIAGAEISRWVCLQKDVHHATKHSPLFVVSCHWNQIKEEMCAIERLRNERANVSPASTKPATRLLLI